MSKLGKKFKYKTILKSPEFYIIILFAILRIIFGGKVGCFYASSQGADDQLLARYSMLYDHFNYPNIYSLVKTMSYPLFINIVYVLHIKYTTALSILWIIDALFVYKIVKEITQSRVISISSYLYVLFFYTAFGLWTGTRMYRNAIIAPFVLLTICLFIKIILQIKRQFPSFKNILTSIFLSIIFTFTYYIKEDGLWLLACLLFVIIICIGILIYRLKTKNNEIKINKIMFIKFSLILFIPIIVFYILTNCYKTINNHYYGVYEIETRTSGNLGEFVNLIYKIKSDNRTSSIWAPADAIKKAYEVSETFQQYPELYDNITKNPIKGDFLTWTLRTSLEETEIWKSEKQINDLFEQINSELKQAFNDEKLEKETRIQLLGSAGGRTLNEILQLGKYVYRGFIYQIMLEGYEPGVKESEKANMQTIEVYRIKTGEELKIKKSDIELKEDEKINSYIRRIFEFYKVINIICFNVMIIIICFYIIKYLINIKNIKQIVNNEMFEIAIIVTLFSIAIVYMFAITWFAEFILTAENEATILIFYGVAVPSLLVFPYSLSMHLFALNIKKMFNKIKSNINLEH